MAAVFDKNPISTIASSLYRVHIKFSKQKVSAFAKKYILTMAIYELFPY